MMVVSGGCFGSDGGNSACYVVDRNVHSDCGGLGCRQEIICVMMAEMKMLIFVMVVLTVVAVVAEL